MPNYLCHCISPHLVEPAILENEERATGVSIATVFPYLDNSSLAERVFLTI